MTENTKSEEGRKFDAGKLRYDLVPTHALEAVVGVLTYGAKKYDDENWRKVEDYERRYYAAALRHIEKHRQGEYLDSESGKPHLAHAVCCLMFLLEKGEERKSVYSFDRSDVGEEKDFSTTIATVSWCEDEKEKREERNLSTASTDRMLGRIIREKGVSVMRVNAESAGPDEWSACNAPMDENFGHNGKWGNASTPLGAVAKVLNNG